MNGDKKCFYCIKNDVDTKIMCKILETLMVFLGYSYISSLICIFQF